MYNLGEKTEFTATDLKPDTCYSIISKGIEIIVKECSIKEAAIEEIKSQPFF